MRNIINSTWFSQLGHPGTIGIVHMLDEFDGDLFFIGTADGYDKIDDERHIADTGGKFPIDAGLKLFNLKIK
jgi:hypothetical protein